MTIGTSLFIIAVGAILRYAVKDNLDWINLNTTGLVLMIIGVIGLVLGIYFSFVRGNPPDQAPPPPRAP